MIHILFMILKALGVLLLVLLVLVLLIVCTVLFLPFCYRAQVLKEEEGFACVKASGRVSWLFGAVALTASYEEQKPEAQILLFGASLETWKRRLKKDPPGEKRPCPGRRKNETENAPEAEKTAEQKAEAKKEQTSAEQPAEQKTDTVKKQMPQRDAEKTQKAPDQTEKTAEGDSTEGAARARAGTGCAEKKHSGTVFRKDRISSGKTAESCQPSAADSFPAVGTSVPSA